MERPIDFLIIGAQKSATTALYTWLGEHPDIYLPAVKENPYFVKDDLYSEGDRFLEPFYDGARSDQLLGGAYVHLLYFTEAAKRIRDHNPEMKLIAVLRNPIDRAYSAYWFARRNGWEEAESFEDALEREEDRRTGSFRERAELTYLTHGRYAEQLECYRDVFPDTQLKVVLTQNIRRQPVDTYRSLLRWLNVRTNISIPSVGSPEHVAGWPKFRRLQKLLLGEDNSLRRGLRRLIPPRCRYWIRKHILLPLARYNIEPARYPEMDPSTRVRLINYFRPHNRRLEELLDCDLEEWKQ